MLFQRLSACLWTALAVVGAANAYEGDPDVRSIPVSLTWSLELGHALRKLTDALMFDCLATDSQSCTGMK